jgi:hypothetical protein
MSGMPLALADTLAVAALPADVRREIDLLTPLIQDVLKAPHGAKRAAQESAARQMTAAGFEITWNGIRELVPIFKREGWRGLIDHRKLEHEDHTLPAAFKEEVKRRFERHGRSVARAQEDLIRDWRTGKPIPGYPKPPKAQDHHSYPRGWSLKNLERVCKSSSWEKAAMRVGLGYANAKHGVKHYTTRVDLWHLSHVMLDDVDHDNFVYVGTKSQTCRVSQLGALDVFSGCYFHHGTHPQLKRWDPKQEKLVTDKLKEANTRYLVASQLFKYGYSPLGTEYVVERATATIREETARILHDRTKAIHGEALVKVNLGGWTGKQQVVAGMFLGDGGGNPRHKAPLESWHNLLHNWLGALPGQTGPDVARRPEQLAGLLKANEELMTIAKQLSPWAAQRLKFPLQEYWTEFIPILAETIRLINERRTHNLEGWIELKFLSDQYRFHTQSEEWLSQEQYLALPDATQAWLREQVRGNTALHRPSRLAPADVFAMQRGGVCRASMAMIAEILYRDLATERKCRNGYFAFDDQEISHEELRYHSRICTPDGRQEELTGDKYEVVVSPMQPELLWIYTGKGAFLGTAPRAAKSSRIDEDQNKLNLAFEQKRLADLAKPLKARHADIARDRAADLKHNNDVLASGHTTEAEARFANHDAAPVLSDCISPERPVQHDFSEEEDPLDPTKLL